MDTQHAQDLIKVLLDTKADIGGRGDAAMDLSEVDVAEGRQALLVTACDP
ncbi:MULTISPECIES: hypothetical protein [Streptomyces]